MFSRRFLWGTSSSLRPCLRSLSTTGSSSDAHTSIIRNCLLNRNTSSLKTELLKLVGDATTIRKNGKVVNGRVTNNATTTVVSFPALAARLCVTTKLVDLDLAFEILECLDEAKPNSMLLGMYEVIDRCLLMGHVAEAANAYRRLHNTGHKLDMSGLERLVSALVYECRLDDLTMVLSNHSLSDDMLVKVVEPLVLSGDPPLWRWIISCPLLTLRSPTYVHLSYIFSLCICYVLAFTFNQVISFRLQIYFDDIWTKEDPWSTHCNVLIAFHEFCNRSLWRGCGDLPHVLMSIPTYVYKNIKVCMYLLKSPSQHNTFPTQPTS